MSQQRNKSSWSLRDLVDFEVLLEKGDLWQKSWRNGVQNQLDEERLGTELERRRCGFRTMLEVIREDESEQSGRQFESVSRLLSFLAWLIMLLMGIGVVRGLLVEFEYHDMDGEELQMQGYNIWVLLGTTIGLQWLLMIAGTLTYWLWRRRSGDLGILPMLLRKVIQKWGGDRLVGDVWGRLETRVSGGRSVVSWRLAMIFQVGGIGYNCGLLLGLFGCLWFFQIGFYWESTLPQLGRDTLLKLTEILSFASGEIQPSVVDVDQAKLGTELIQPSLTSMPQRNAIDLTWAFFFLFAIAVWGLLPKFLMWASAVWMERRTLAKMEFQEARHRELWRKLTKVQRGEIQNSPADGAVLLDIGGLEISTETIRPFCLQVLRINPEARFSLGTLNVEEERRALEQARSAAMGVVFLVEGWNLSPKQIQRYHQQVRNAIGDKHMVRYLVLGSEEELKQWEAFVDSLKDSESVVYRYHGAD